jgi:hypothetical protein
MQQASHAGHPTNNRCIESVMWGLMHLKTPGSPGLLPGSPCSAPQGVYRKHSSQHTFICMHAQRRLVCMMYSSLACLQRWSATPLAHQILVLDWPFIVEALGARGALGTPTQALQQGRSALQNPPTGESNRDTSYMTTQPQGYKIQRRTAQLQLGSKHLLTITLVACARTDPAVKESAQQCMR